jgi:hypothetical protein
MTPRAALAVLATGIVVALSADLGAEAVDPAIATPIEQALIEQACSAPAYSALQGDAHDDCLHEKLSALRADFGRDLSRLAAPERRKIDSTCGQVREAQGRSGYLDCIGNQLVAIKAHWGRTRGPAVEATAVADSSPVAPVVAAVPASDPGVRPSRGWLFPVVVTIAAAGAGVAVALRTRGSRRVCRVCQAKMGTPGDLCPTCRHEAAETLRRGAAERAERQRVQDDQERFKREQEEEERRRMTQDAEDARLRQDELTRQCEEAAQRLEEEARRRDAEAAQQRRSFGDEEEQAFDPYAVLGVPRGASVEAVHAAYEQAKAKYDLEQVEDLGSEIKQHYINKAQAVDRAFQMLADRTPDVQAPDAPAEPVNGVTAY